MATYNDLNRTNYPNALDDRPDAIQTANRNPHFKVNINFENRTATTAATDYIVLADDVNALQEAIMAVQRSLGVMPQGTNLNDSVSQRFVGIENFTLYNESKELGFNTIDERLMWGGQRPSIGGDPAPLISIRQHIHSGTAGQADKISLTSHVTGLLKSVNIDLTSNSVNMLSASNIRMSTSSAQTISDKFDEKMDKGGGSFTGDVTIEGNFTSRGHVEMDAKDMLSSAGKGYSASASDPYADSGYTRKAVSANTTGILCYKTVNLRYGKYVAIFRIKVLSNASTNTIAKIGIKAVNGTTDLAAILVKPTDFASANTYQSFFVEFDHGYFGGHYKTVTPQVYFYTGVTDLSVDSIVIEPITTALYDDDNF